jgi:hypothetical protein
VALYHQPVKSKQLNNIPIQKQAHIEMRYMSLIGIIQEGQALIINGVQYPGDFPKANIPGLSPIVETDSGATENQVAIESIELVNGTYTQVWSVREKTKEELAAELKAKVPLAVTPLQGEFALKQMYPDAYAALKLAITGMDDDSDMKIAFNRALEWRRNSPLTLQMLTLLGIEEAAADQLFTEAAKIEV